MNVIKNTHWSVFAFYIFFLLSAAYTVFLLYFFISVEFKVFVFVFPAAAGIGAALYAATYLFWPIKIPDNLNDREQREYLSNAIDGKHECIENAPSIAFAIIVIYIAAFYF